MRKTLLSLALITNFAFSAGIPVFDPAAQADRLKSYTEQMKQWGETAQHYKNMYDNATEQLNSLKNIYKGQFGISNSVKYLKDVEDFYKLAGTDNNSFWNLADEILSDNPKTELGRQAKEYFKNSEVFDTCKGLDNQERKLCLTKRVNIASNLATYDKYSQALNTTSKNLAILRQKAINATDPKEREGIQIAIQAELANLETTKAQVELLTKKLELDEKLAKEQGMQLLSKKLNEDIKNND